MTLANLPHFSSLNDALHSLFGNHCKTARTRPVSGGDINNAYQLILNDGTEIFMKTNTKENISFFTTETVGLAAIAQTNTIGTPHILCCGTDKDNGNIAFLLMEFIKGKQRIADYWETFAHELASMHQAPTEDFTADGKYGFFQNNYIGAGKQINTPQTTWIDFFRECRLEPQFQTASSYFNKTDVKKISHLLERLDNILTEPEHPSLLHGDLWSGNVIAGNNGKIWLIDPAAYVGHAEADIAMTELFGGFPQIFYDAYRETVSMPPDYQKRRDIYNLYHLLNHLNLFGPMYLPAVKRTVDYYYSGY